MMDDVYEELFRYLNEVHRNMYRNVQLDHEDLSGYFFIYEVYPDFHKEIYCVRRKMQ